MGNRKSMDELFGGRHFDREVIILCVRWYLRYKLSFRDLVEMMAERGLSLDHTVSALSFRKAIRYGAEIFHTLKKMLHENKLVTAVGDEGGFAPSVANHEAAIQLILHAVEQAVTSRAPRSRWARATPHPSSTGMASTT